MKRMHVSGAGFSIVALTMLSAAAHAGLILTPTTQLRETEVLAQITGEGSALDSDLESAPGFATFNSTIDADVSLGEFENPVTASSDGLQVSDILTAAIKASGEAHAMCSPQDPGLLPDSFGRSYFSLTFTLDEAVGYSLTGELTAGFENGGEPLAFVQLESTLDGTLYYLETLSGSAPVISGGVLPAGEYTLSALALAIAEPSNNSADAYFNIEFHLVPEPGAAALLLIGALTALRSARRR